jgi:hypothetical protein
MTCISCNHQHDEKFCPNCGEKREIPKITLISTINGSFATLTNMDKGFLFNLKHLTLQPKTTIEKYLKGKRKGIFNPISFLIISISSYLLIESIIKVSSPIPEESTELAKNTLYYKVGLNGGRFIHEYFKFFWILTVIPLSFITKLLYQKYNLIEHITINSFILGHITLLTGIVSYLIFKFTLLFNPFIYLSLIWYLHRVFYNPKDKWESLMKALVSVLLLIIILLLVIIAVGITFLNQS